MKGVSVLVDIPHTRLLFCQLKLIPFDVYEAKPQNSCFNHNNDNNDNNDVNNNSNDNSNDNHNNNKNMQKQYN